MLLIGGVQKRAFGAGIPPPSFAMADSDDDQMVFDMGASRPPQPAGPVEAEPTARAVALQKAVKDSVKAMAEFGIEAPDEKTIADAQKRAEAMIENGDIQGMVEMRKLVLGQSLPAIRVIFRQMADAVGLKGSARAKVETKIMKISPITDKVCVQYDFIDRTTGAANAAYMMLDECPRNYDFGAVLQTFLAKLPAEKEKEVLHRSSMLFNAGRTFYAQLAVANLPLIRKINSLPGGDPCTQFLQLQVDKANTTLFIDPSWPKRVGLVIHYKDELDVAPAT